MWSYIMGGLLILVWLIGAYKEEVQIGAVLVYSGWLTVAPLFIALEQNMPLLYFYIVSVIPFVYIMKFQSSGESANDES